MRLASVLATAAIVVSCGAATVQAQSSDKIVPAEFPPDGYQGRQYVDSKGCVFIRAGVDGNVTWVPRMTRSREHICGFKPTLTASARPDTPAPRPAAESEPEPAAKPAPRTAAVEQAPDPKPRAARAPSYRRAPAPPAAPVKPKAPEKAVAKPDNKRVVSAVCRGASPLSQKYINTSTGLSVRCGPQSAPHVTYKSGARTTAAPVRDTSRKPAYTTVPRAGATGYRTGPARVAPKRVYERQLASTRGVRVPDGYAPVWEDDRLNTRRAHQTLAGKAQMDLVWTKTVPRRLIIRETGQVVTRHYPGLRYPYTSYAEQKSALAGVSTRGTTRHAGAAQGQHPSARNAPAPARQTAAARVSTRSAPAQAETTPRAESASHRYVQLGAFPDPDHAMRAAKQVANSGLPARMGDITRNGKDYKIVLAGPFETQAQLTAGLQRVRGMGYSRAFLRK
ncbi:SPOR domain-containing protein [Roseovarius salis]|uniref:SPOR domain-containing protein n=1 Tax=Roseovarius salis TaxID=3376063 RepID=UPI0037C529D1